MERLEAKGVDGQLTEEQLPRDKDRPDTDLQTELFLKIDRDPLGRL